jgi:hypothetical protein
VALSAAWAAMRSASHCATWGDGAWSVTVPRSALVSSVLPDGSYTVTADVWDQYGNAAQEATRPLTVQEGSVIDTDKLILVAPSRLSV